MSDTTPRLALPELLAAQSQKHVTVNEALLKLDALSCLYLLGQFVNTPPASPADGDCYLTGGSPTGAWSGYAYKIAACLDGGWRFHTPFDGLQAILAPNNARLVYVGGAWLTVGADRYEEGTFAPTLSFGAAAAGLSYASQFGKYTRIGNALAFALRIALSAKGTSTGAALIGGLPYAATGAANAYSYLSLGIGNMQGNADGSRFLMAYVAPAAQSAHVATAAGGDLTNADFTNGSVIALTGRYFL
jgi:hypothetical protein